MGEKNTKSQDDQKAEAILIKKKIQEIKLELEFIKKAHAYFKPKT